MHGTYSARSRFDQVVQQIFEINTIVGQLDTSIRVRAFELLMSVRQEECSAKPSGQPLADLPPDLLPKHLLEFVKCYRSGIPSRDLVMLAAWLYFNLRDNLITPQKLRALAMIADVELPHRPDCTLRYSSSRSQHLFVRRGNGWILSDYGGAYVRRLFGTLETVPDAVSSGDSGPAAG